MANPSNRQLDPGDGGAIYAPGNWSTASDVGAAAQATITQAAAGAGLRNVCNFISAMIACGATAQTPVKVYLRDGATGTGAILWEGVLAAPADGSGIVCLSGLNIMGTPGAAMTLEFAAAGVAASVEAVTLGGYVSIK